MLLKVLFVILMVIHGLIHIMGFVKAFDWSNITQLQQDISKVSGILWLCCTIGFLITAALYMAQKDWWWIIALVSLLGSQLLIISHWQDARMGTIINCLILLVSITSYASWNFNRLIEESLNSFQHQPVGANQIISTEAVQEMPLTVQKWLLSTNVIGHELNSIGHFQQSGSMRTTAGGAWMPFLAEQWISSTTPGFIWAADVGKGIGVRFSGLDKYQNGKGSMLIKLFSLIPVVNEKGPYINQGALVRYLAEIVWLPQAAFNKKITWEEVDRSKVKAIMKDGEVEASGIFSFNKDGKVIGFEAQRYCVNQNEATLENWMIAIDPNSYKEFQGIRIPTKASITWGLAEGEFTWYQVAITHAKYEKHN